MTSVYTETRPLRRNTEDAQYKSDVLAEEALVAILDLVLVSAILWQACSWHTLWHKNRRKLPLPHHDFWPAFYPIGAGV